jgi:hypothetical protein
VHTVFATRSPTSIETCEKIIEQNSQFNRDEIEFGIRYLSHSMPNRNLKEPPQKTKDSSKFLHKLIGISHLSRENIINILISNRDK